MTKPRVKFAGTSKDPRHAVTLIVVATTNHDLTSIHMLFPLERSDFFTPRRNSTAPTFKSQQQTYSRENDAALAV